MDSLGIGGGEKSLVTLLSLIDYTKYDVDLQLFSLVYKKPKPLQKPLILCLNSLPLPLK